MNLENRARGLKTLPHSGPGAFNWSFLSSLLPVSVLLPGGRKVGFPSRAGEGQSLGLGGLPADREVTIPVFLFQFPGVNVGSADVGSGVNIQPKASWGSAIAKHCGHHSCSSYVWLAYNLRGS
ncbi:hypothetical protein Ddye_016891 [Dipteronia dyeriana]|uniref:Uncharacterized protein n=1 Tax=Dipteronia dyeriana TaxID=168575 RepID=A0AAD9U7P8_9ROSI|nr:hypothetical protein Ddye_016891 [Dipteronia dyeriana]